MNIRPWTQVVRLHPDVESESTAISTYAIDLGALVMKDPYVPPTYRDAHAFFRATHLTSGIKRLIEEVAERLSGKEGNRVLQLRSPFGGGKSHTLAALYYSVKERKALEDTVPEMKALPNPEAVRIAVFDGEKFDAVSGKEVDGQKIQTMWGWVAYQLGDYDLVKEHDQKRIAPGGDLVKRILLEKPTLLLLDEVLRYLERAMGERVGDSTLARQALDFIGTLTTEVSGSRNSCLVYSLQASAREAYGNVDLLSILDHYAARVDAKREPIIGDEIFPVLRKRLLAEPPSEEMANRVADIYTDLLKKNILSYIPKETERHEIEEAIIKNRERFVMAYPFHPSLIDLMKERWASIPDFQRTRGVLRFLAAVLRTLKKRAINDLLVSATNLPLDDAEVRNAFFTEVGSRDAFQAVLEADFTGPNATLKRIDKEIPEVTRPATRTGIAVLLYSFGGQPRIEGKEGETYPSGVTEQDLMTTIISQDLDSTTMKAVLKEMVGKCLYIHYDGVRYAFKTTPNVNKVLEDEATGIREDEIKNTIKQAIEKDLAGKPAIIWASESKKIPDNEPKFTIAYLPLDFVYERNPDEKALELLTQYGDKPRIYRNGLALAIPDKNQITPLFRSVQYLIAIDRIKGRKKSLNLTEEQMEQLKEREKTERAGMESSLRSLYNSVCLLKVENGVLTSERLEIGGRPLQALDIHGRLMELLTRVHKKVFESLTPAEIIKRMRLGKEDKPGIETKDILQAFFSTPDFPCITDEEVIRKSLAEGVRKGQFGLTSRDKVQITQDRPVVSPEQVTIDQEISEDEVDVSDGFVIIREVIDEFKRKEGEEEKPEEDIPPEENPLEADKKVSLKYILKFTKAQFFKSHKALWNLFEKSDEVSLTIEAKSEEGFDAHWVRNAVEEPMDEAGIKVDVNIKP